MRFRELLFQLALDLQRCAKRQGSGANAVQTRMGAQQFSGGGLKMGQCLFDYPSFADQPIDTAAVFLRWVHGAPLSLVPPFAYRRPWRAKLWYPPFSPKILKGPTSGVDSQPL